MPARDQAAEEKKGAEPALDAQPNNDMHDDDANDNADRCSLCSHAYCRAASAPEAGATDRRARLLACCGQRCCSQCLAKRMAEGQGCPGCGDPINVKSISGPGLDDVLSVAGPLLELASAAASPSKLLLSRRRLLWLLLTALPVCLAALGHVPKIPAGIGWTPPGGARHDAALHKRLDKLEAVSSANGASIGHVRSQLSELVDSVRENEESSSASIRSLQTELAELKEQNAAILQTLSQLLETEQQQQQDLDKEVQRARRAESHRQFVSLMANSAILQLKHRDGLSRLFDEHTSTQARLLYRGTRDGLNSDVFRIMVDGEAPTLTIIKTTENGVPRVFGGFTPAAWSLHTGWVEDPSLRSFVFSLESPLRRTLQWRLSKGERALWCSPGRGPNFGFLLEVDLPGVTFNRVSSEYTLRADGRRGKKKKQKKQRKQLSDDDFGLVFGGREDRRHAGKRSSDIEEIEVFQLS